MMVFTDFTWRFIVADYCAVSDATPQIPLNLAWRAMAPSQKMGLRVLVLIFAKSAGSMKT